MERLEELGNKILAVLLPYGVKRVALFGSVVRNEQRPDSDIDILVALKPPEQRAPIGLKWYGLEEELGRILGRPVDLIEEASLNRHIRPYVQKEMVILYDEG